MAEVLATTDAPAGSSTRGSRPAGAAPVGPPALKGRRAWARRAPLMPALIYMIVVTQIPFVVTLWYSFRGWNTLTPGSNRWVGLEEYKLVFTDPVFRSAIVNTVVITGSAVILSMLLGIGLAILLNRKFFGRGLIRTLLITPFLVMPVATALLYKTTVYDPIFGLLDWVLSPFGVHQVNWIGSYAAPSVVAVLVWEWTPFMMLIVLAGLQSESLESLEAARVDGANAVQTFIAITFPHLRRYVELGMLLGSIYLLQTFGEIFVLTQGGGGHGTATTNLPYYIYELAFQQFNVSEAAAAGVIVVIGTEIVASIALRLLSGLFRMAEGVG